VIQQRLTAIIEGDFVIFLIGMRINRFWKVHKWLPVFRGMPRMPRELAGRPDSGLLGFHLHNGLRNHLVVQYWRSFEHLERYARDPAGAHFPAWVAFNRSIGSNGDVGIWHETYRVTAGQYEAIYNNMPADGLGAASGLAPAAGPYSTAAGRIGLRKNDSAPVDVAGAIRG
jgi:hypothetical protein